MSDDDEKERFRLHLTDAVASALEAGMTAEEIAAEVDYALDTGEE